MGLESAVTNSAEVKAISAKDSQACAAGLDSEKNSGAQSVPNLGGMRPQSPHPYYSIPVKLAAS